MIYLETRAIKSNSFSLLLLVQKNIEERGRVGNFFKNYVVSISHAFYEKNSRIQ